MKEDNLGQLHRIIQIRKLRSDSLNRRVNSLCQQLENLSSKIAEAEIAVIEAERTIAYREQEVLGQLIGKPNERQHIDEFIKLQQAGAKHLGDMRTNVDRSIFDHSKTNKELQTIRDNALKANKNFELLRYAIKQLSDK